MPIQIDPAASTAQAAVLEASAAAMQGVIAAALPALANALPAGAEEVSAAAASGFSAHGAGSGTSAQLGQISLLSSAASQLVATAGFVASDAANAVNVGSSVTGA